MDRIGKVHDGIHKYFVAATEKKAHARDTRPRRRSTSWKQGAYCQANSRG